MIVFRILSMEDIGKTKSAAQSYEGKDCAARFLGGGHLHSAQNRPGGAVLFAPAAVIAQAGVNDRAAAMNKNCLGGAAFEADAAVQAGGLLTKVHRPANKGAPPAGHAAEARILQRPLVVHKGSFLPALQVRQMYRRCWSYHLS